MDDAYKNIEEYNPNRKRKTLILFDDMTADLSSNNKLNTLVTIRGRKLNISLATQSYFVVPKIIRLNSTYYFIMKIPDKRELQQTAFNYSLDIHQIMNLNKKYTAKPYYYFVIDTTLESYNHLRFRQYQLERI